MMMLVRHLFCQSYPFIPFLVRFFIQYLRIMLLTKNEFLELGKQDKASFFNDIFIITRGMLSVSNEYHVLKALAAIARVRLTAYQHSLKEHVDLLVDESIPMFSNQRNTLVLVGNTKE